jgi:predicted metal-dependent hydrolase
MQLEHALALAWELMEEHGLLEQSWTVLPSRARKFIGLCCYDSQVIYLSEFHVPRMPETEVRDVILHEIAHALAGSGHGHDWAWQAVATRLGAQPKPTKNCSYYYLMQGR